MEKEFDQKKQEAAYEKIARQQTIMEQMGNMFLESDLDPASAPPEVLKAIIKKYNLDEELARSGKTPSEFFKENNGELLEKLRLRNYLDKTFIAAKGLGETRLRQKFLADAVKGILNPTDEKEKINGYNHFIEIIVQQGIAAELKKVKADKEWAIALTEADEDFSYGGTDLQFTYQGMKLHGFTVMVDLTLARARKVAEKKEAQNQRQSENSFLTVVSLNSGPDHDQPQKWHGECEQIIQSIRNTGKPDWSVLKENHSFSAISTTFFDSIIKSLKEFKNTHTDKATEADSQITAITELRDLFIGSNLDK